MVAWQRLTRSAPPEALTKAIETYQDALARLAALSLEVRVQPVDRDINMPRRRASRLVRLLDRRARGG
jgi:hypothetical protein